MSLPDHYQDTKGNAFGSFHIPRKYEEYAHVIEFTIRGKSSTVKKTRRYNNTSNWRRTLNITRITRGSISKFRDWRTCLYWKGRKKQNNQCFG